MTNVTINIKWDKIKNQLIVKYLLSYFCRLNTLKGTAKVPTVDLSRLNNWTRIIRKVKAGGEKTKQKSCIEEVNEKMSCRVNCTVALKPYKLY